MPAIDFPTSPSEGDVLAADSTTTPGYLELAILLFVLSLTLRGLELIVAMGT